MVRQRRRILIDIASRRQKPGTGSSYRVLRSLPVQEWPNLGPILSGLQWAIVGAVAARNYMPERATRDLDIAVATSDIPEATRRLLQAGFKKQMK